MKALSVRQPWPWAILNAGKRLENRDWAGCSYRGPVLLHAGQSVGTIAEFDSAVEFIVDGHASHPLLGQLSYDERREAWRPGRQLPVGGIVGRANIVGEVRREKDLDRFPGANRRWWMGGFALVLDDVEELPFLPFKGALGFFDVPAFAAFGGKTPAREPRCLVCGGHRHRPMDIDDACVNCWGSGVSPTMPEALARHAMLQEAGLR